MLVFLFISKTKKSSAQSVNVKLVFSCKIHFFSNWVKVIGFRDFFFVGGGSDDVIVSDRFRSEKFLNPVQMLGWLHNRVLKCTTRQMQPQYNLIIFLHHYSKVALPMYMYHFHVLPLSNTNQNLFHQSRQRHF